MRERMGNAIGVPATNIMLNLSHNHSSPCLPDWVPDTEEQTRLKTRYRDDLSDWLVEAVQEADSRLRPARIGAGWGESDIGIYRRETGPDGRDVLGEMPDHPIDPSVGVVRVDDLDGNPITVLFSYGCHPVTVGPRSMVGTPDFPGPAREVIEKCLGGTAIFLQACGGNINPRPGIGYEVDCRDVKGRIGMALGAEALRVAAGIRTHLEPGDRIPLGNVPNILFRPGGPRRGTPAPTWGRLKRPSGSNSEISPPARRPSGSATNGARSWSGGRPAMPVSGRFASPPDLQSGPRICWRPPPRTIRRWTWKRRPSGSTTSSWWA